jgi:hypothetical protein
MDAVIEARERRRRAGTLRRFALLIAGAELGALARLAGDDTWYGPTAGAFLDDCRAVDRLVDGAVRDLRGAARRLEQQADELERSTLVPGPVVGW